MNIINKLVFQVKKYSPEILTGLGICGGIGATVLACKATVKAVDIMKEHNEEINMIEQCASNNEIQYSKEEEKKNRRIIYSRTALGLIKVYSPSIILGAASISSILSGHKIISKRYTAVSTAYAALDAGFKKYKERVVKKLGEEAEKEIRYGIVEKEVETTDEKGKKKKETIKVAEYPLGSPYAMFFDEASALYSKDRFANKTTLLGIQDLMNIKLKEQGYLYLNDVYRALCLPENKYVQYAGWIYDKNNNPGDNYVDFGIFDLKNDKEDEDKVAFVNGNEKSILLDFNCIPNIYSRCGKQPTDGFFNR